MLGFPSNPAARPWCAEGVRPGARLDGWLVAALLGVFVSGCGAKTGLMVPDAGVDAGVEVLPTLCIELPNDGRGAVLPLQTRAVIGRADVALLVDVSASMQGEIDAIRAELREVIVPGIEAEIPEVRLSVASFSDFPQFPFGLPGVDHAFQQRVAMTGDITNVQGGVDSLTLADGQDHPEAHVEALYQLATGEGLPGWIEPSLGCAGGGFGYPCFRDDALPVVLVFTDAPMHVGPTAAEPYAGLTPAPHVYEDARRALVDAGLRVISFYSGPSGDTDRLDLELLGRDTGSLDTSGVPFVFDIGPDGNGLGSDVIDAIKVFTANLVFDVELQVRDDVLDDGVDATMFIESIRPVSALPMGNVDSLDAEASIFRGVISGTELVFEVTLRNGAVAAGVGPQTFELTAVFRADGRDVLGETSFEIVVPGADGSGCASLTR